MNYDGHQATDSIGNVIVGPVPPKVLASAVDYSAEWRGNAEAAIDLLKKLPVAIQEVLSSCYDMPGDYETDKLKKQMMVEWNWKRQALISKVRS